MSPGSLRGLSDSLSGSLWQGQCIGRCAEKDRQTNESLAFGSDPGERVDAVPSDPQSRPFDRLGASARIQIMELAHESGFIDGRTRLRTAVRNAFPTSPRPGLEPKREWYFQPAAAPEHGPVQQFKTLSPVFAAAPILPKNHTKNQFSDTTSHIEHFKR